MVNVVKSMSKSRTRAQEIMKTIAFTTGVELLCSPRQQATVVKISMKGRANHATISTKCKNPSKDDR